MIAAFFFYYNFKFSEYKFVDFNKIVLYTRSDIFEPKSNEYYLLVFSSRMSDLKKLLKQIPHDHPILAVDIYQKRLKIPGVIYTTAGINTIIKLIQYLNIYEVPVVVKIKRYHEKIYKQNSPLKILRS
jgi:hypothetical protein